MSWAGDNNFDGYDVEEHIEQKSTPTRYFCMSNIKIIEETERAYKLLSEKDAFWIAKSISWIHGNVIYYPDWVRIKYLGF